MKKFIEPTPQEIKDQKIYTQWGLTDEEYAMIENILNRMPNYTETGLFSVMWSEHCSYKNSKPVLKKPSIPAITSGQQNFIISLKISLSMCPLRLSLSK